MSSVRWGGWSLEAIKENNSFLSITVWKVSWLEPLTKLTFSICSVCWCQRLRCCLDSVNQDARDLLPVCHGQVPSPQWSAGDLVAAENTCCRIQMFHRLSAQRPEALELNPHSSSCRVIIINMSLSKIKLYNKAAKRYVKVLGKGLNFLLCVLSDFSFYYVYLCQYYHPENKWPLCYARWLY